MKPYLRTKNYIVSLSMRTTCTLVPMLMIPTTSQMFCFPLWKKFNIQTKCFQTDLMGWIQLSKPVLFGPLLTSEYRESHLATRCSFGSLTSIFEWSLALYGPKKKIIENPWSKKPDGFLIINKHYRNYFSAISFQSTSGIIDPKLWLKCITKFWNHF